MAKIQNGIRTKSKDIFNLICILFLAKLFYFDRYILQNICWVSFKTFLGKMFLNGNDLNYLDIYYVKKKSLHVSLPANSHDDLVKFRFNDLNQLSTS